jgi:hypothetical protein
MRAAVGRADEGAHVFSTLGRVYDQTAYTGHIPEEAVVKALPQEEDVR